MATIVCVSNDLPGIIFANLEMARRLTVAGHDVTFACSRDVSELATANGVAFQKLRPIDTQPDRSRTILQQVEAATPRDFEDLLDRLQPQLALIDLELHEHIVVALAKPARLALTSTFVSIWRRRELPPTHHHVTPGQGLLGSRVGIWALWQGLRLRKLWRQFRQRLQHRGRDRVSVLRRVAKQRGIHLAPNVDRSHWVIPFNYRHLPVITARAPEFDFPHDPEPRARFVGPMLLARRGEGFETADPTLRAVLDRAQSDRRTLVLAAFGAFYSSAPRLVAELCRAFDRLPDHDLILVADPEHVPDPPPNVHVFRWIPQLEVLQRAAVVIHHGGANTIDEAILHGVPALVYPGNATDMGGGAARVVHHGLGVVGDRELDDADVIIGRLRELGTSTEIRAHVDSMRTRYRARDPQRAIEAAVESLLE